MSMLMANGAPMYVASTAYAAPATTTSYVAPTTSYSLPTTSYVAPTTSYPVPTTSYVAQTPSYVAPPMTYAAPVTTSYVQQAVPITYSQPKTFAQPVTYLQRPGKTGSAPTKQEITMADGWSSSCAWRVRIMIALKGIEVKQRFVFPWSDNQFNDGLKAEGPELLTCAEATAINPMREVPWVETRGVSGEPVMVTQSTAIAELLEELYPDPPLLPKDPWSRAGVREMVQVVNSGIQPCQMDLERHARGLNALVLLNERYGAAGPYMAGSSITIADAFLIPALANARFFGVDVSAYPRLLSIEAACEQHPAFIAAAPEKQSDCPPPTEEDFQKRYPSRVPVV